MSYSRPLRGYQLKKKAGRDEKAGDAHTWRLKIAFSVLERVPSYLSVHWGINQGLTIGEMRLNSKKHFAVLLLLLSVPWLFPCLGAAVAINTPLHCMCRAVCKNPSNEQLLGAMYQKWSFANLVLCIAVNHWTITWHMLPCCENTGTENPPYLHKMHYTLPISNLPAPSAALSHSPQLPAI